MTRPRLDRPTIVAYVQLALLSFFLTGFGPTQALLRDEQGTTKVIGGLHATVFAVAGIIAALIAPRLIERLGRSRVISIGVVLFGVGLAGYLTPAGPALTLPSIGLASMCSATLLICLSSFLLDYQGAAGPSSLTQANALAAFSSVLAPIAIGIGAAIFLGWRAGLWVMVVALIVTELLLRRPMRRLFTIPGQHERRAVPWRELPRGMWWSVVLVALFSAVEMTTFLWAADLLRDRAGVEPALAAGLVAAIPIGMALGRLVGAKLAQSMAIDGLLFAAGLIALVGFAVAWSTDRPLIVSAGLFIVGIGVSLNWPLGISRAVRASGGMSTQATSLASVAGGIALAIVPLTLGALAEGIGIHLAFLILPALLIIALVVIRAKPEVPVDRIPEASPSA